MPEAFRSSDSRLRAFWRSLGGWIARLPRHLPGAVVVASLVTIGRLDYHLLDAIDSYAFIGIGNLSAVEALSNANGDKKPTVALVLIDQPSYEINYQERSPLNRCRLATDLKSLYDLPIPPKLMVIDLDLSPSAQTDDADCQEQLNQLLENSQRSTKTVLMTPLSMRDPDSERDPTREKTKNWQNRMRAANVVFGDPDLPIRYGLVTNIECEEQKLAIVAFREFSNNRPSICLDGQGNFQSDKEFLINPRQYVMGLRPVSALSLPSPLDQFSEWSGRLPNPGSCWWCSSVAATATMTPT